MNAFASRPSFYSSDEPDMDDEVDLDSLLYPETMEYDVFCQLDQGSGVRRSHHEVEIPITTSSELEHAFYVDDRNAALWVDGLEWRAEQQRQRWQRGLDVIDSWRKARNPKPPHHEIAEAPPGWTPHSWAPKPFVPAPPKTSLTAQLVRDYEADKIVRRAAAMALAASMGLLASCTGYTGAYISPTPPAPSVLPYDGPNPVTVIDHGPVPSGIYIRSTPSSSYSGYSSGYGSGDSFESPYAWSFPDQSPYYSSGSSCYSRPVYYHRPAHSHRTESKPFFQGSDYGYSSYRDATSGSSSRRRSR